jgi:hypothetical protein
MGTQTVTVPLGGGSQQVATNGVARSLSAPTPAGICTVAKSQSGSDVIITPLKAGTATFTYLSTGQYTVTVIVPVSVTAPTGGGAGTIIPSGVHAVPD